VIQVQEKLMFFSNRCDLLPTLETAGG
jgi:hypothetical protein